MDKKKVKNYLVLKSHTKDALKYLAFSLFIVVTLSLSSINLNNYLNENKVLGAKTESALETNLISNIEDKEITYWTDFLTSNPTYSPGWIELTKLYLGKNEIRLAYKTLEIANTITPNSPEIKVLTQKINSL